MKRTSILLLAACVLFSVVATAAVTVNFTKPENYTDMPLSSWDRESTLKTLQAHFDKLGATLPAGQDLKVEVLDIDLAGRIRPTFSYPHEIRVLRGMADWPMIQLRYSIESKGQVLKSGEERVADMNYLGHLNRYFSGESLRYEKAMLDEWFKRTTQLTQTPPSQ